MSERFHQRLLQRLNTFNFFSFLSFLYSQPDPKRTTQIWTMLRITLESSFYTRTTNHLLFMRTVSIQYRDMSVDLDLEEDDYMLQNIFEYLYSMYTFLYHRWKNTTTIVFSFALGYYFHFKRIFVFCISIIWNNSSLFWGNPNATSRWNEWFQLIGWRFWIRTLVKNHTKFIIIKIIFLF